MRALSHEEASSLISAAGGTRDEALIVCWPSGPVMRQGELAALRWEDVELSDEPTITVKRSADTRTQTRISTTKTGEERRVGFGARTVTVLKAHKKRQLEGRMAAPSWQDPGLVFPNTKGKVRRRNSVMRPLKKMLAEADRHPLPRPEAHGRDPGYQAGDSHTHGLQDARALRSGDDAQALRARLGRDARGRGAGLDDLS